MIENDRLHKKNHLWRTMSLVLLLIVVLLIGSVDKSALILGKKEKNKEKIRTNGAVIAKISITGPLFDENKRVNIINQLAENNNVKAVILVVSSPGGAVAPSFNLHDSIKHLSEKKPVVSLVPEIAASGGYVAILPSTRIIASEGAILGSIGVIAYNFNLQELAQKIGIKQEVFRSGTFKGFPSNFETTPEHARLKVQESIDIIHELMINKVSTHRKIPLENARQLATGTTFWGVEAIENGLIDQIGVEADALKWLKNEKKIETTKVQEIDMYNDTQHKSKILGMLKTLFTAYSKKSNIDNIINEQSLVQNNAFNQYMLNTQTIGGYILLLMNSQDNHSLLPILSKYQKEREN